MPHLSIESEQAVIGSCMASAESYDVVSEILVSEDFGAPVMRLMWDVISKLREASRPVDAITVGEMLKISQRWADMGIDTDPVVYASATAESALTFRSMPAYAEIIRGHSISRQLLAFAADTKATANGDDKAEIKIGAVQSALEPIADRNAAKGITPFKKAAHRALQEVSALAEQGGGLRGISTGWSDLDRLTNGLQKGHLIICGGRPSSGKTLCGLNIATHVAKTKPVLFYSLEMSEEELALRAMSAMAKVDYGRLQTGKFTDEEAASLAHQGPAFNTLRLSIDDRSGLSIDQLRARARVAARKEKPALIVVDYLTELSADGENQTLRVGNISRGLRRLAKELNVPVFCLAQLNRMSETRSDHTPIMADLRDSGQIEQDANVIMFVHREEMFDAESPRKGMAEIVIRKQRNGRTGSVHFNFEGHFQRFTSYYGLIPEKNNKKRGGGNMKNILGPDGAF